MSTAGFSRLVSRLQCLKSMLRVREVKGAFLCLDVVDAWQILQHSDRYFKYQLTTLYVTKICRSMTQPVTWHSSIGYCVALAVECAVNL
jgi:hypothetical protein